MWCGKAPALGGCRYTGGETDVGRNGLRPYDQHGKDSV
jgi:hypothetical protein